jgi:hypothetical protein
MNIDHLWDGSEGKTELLGDKHVTVLVHTAQISRGMDLDRSQILE